MNSVDIDISKGRSTITVMRPFGEVVISPFEVCHTDGELSALARLLKSLDGIQTACSAVLSVRVEARNGWTLQQSFGTVSA